MEAFFRQIFTTPMGFELASASWNITCYLSSGMTDGKPRLRATQSTHEVFSRDEKVLAGSNRSFGVVMTTALAVVTLLNVWHSGRLWPWTSGLAALLLALALLWPAILGPLNSIWLRFGLLLHRVVNPIVMALLFYGTVLPTGLVMRLKGRDLLRLKREPDAVSYWIVRDPPGPSPETMRDQF